MQPTSSKKEIWTMGTYSLLTLSIMVGFMYLNTFATEVLKIPASTLATALLIAKSCDFVVSLFCGIIVEKVKLGKKGKNQGWLYYGRWILAVAIMLEVINTSTAPMAARVVVLGLSYTVLNCLMNIMQTAYYGVVAVVAGPNPANRNAMTINMIRQNTVVMLICSFIPTLVTKLPFGSWNYFIVALVFMLPMPWALGNISRLAEGKDLPVGQGPAGAPRVTIKDMLESLFKNPQLLALFISFTILQIGMFMYQANYTYYFIYVIGDFTKLTLATLAASLVGVVAAMFMPKLGTKIGKKWACVVGFILFGLGLVGVNLMGAQHWVWYIIFMSFGTCGTYIYSSFQVTMYLDCGEWYLNKTGKDMRTIAIGLASPPLKIGMAVGGTIGLYLLGATGYVAGFTPDEAWVKSFMFICWKTQPSCSRSNFSIGTKSRPVHNAGRLSLWVHVHVHMGAVNGIGIADLLLLPHQGQCSLGAPAPKGEVHGTARQVPGIGHAAYGCIVSPAPHSAAGDHGNARSSAHPVRKAHQFFHRLCGETAAFPAGAGNVGLVPGKIADVLPEALRLLLPKAALEYGLFELFLGLHPRFPICRQALCSLECLHGAFRLLPRHAVDFSRAIAQITQQKLQLPYRQAASPP